MDGRIPDSLRGLIFDVGDVLYDGSLWRRWLLQLLARMNVRKPYAEFYWEWERKYYSQACLGHGDFNDVLRQYLGHLGLCPGQIDEVCRAAHAREKNEDNDPRAFFGVAPTLARLQDAGYMLAALSNTELDEVDLRRKLALMGLDRFFDLVVSSRNSGAIKPQPQAYRAVLDRWPLQADEVAFIGHDSEELAGAAQAGLLTIAVFHEPNVPADWRIDEFTDLCQLALAPLLRVA